MWYTWLSGHKILVRETEVQLLIKRYHCRWYFNKIWCRFYSCASGQELVAESFHHNEESACSVQEGEFLVGLKDSYLLLKSVQCHIFVHHCIILQKAFVQGYVNPRHHVAPATKLCVVMPNMCGSSVCNLLHVTFLVPKSLRWLQHFWKICGPLLQDNNVIVWVHPYYVFEINARFLWKLMLFSYCSR